MKIVSEKELAEFDAAVQKGGIKGFFYGVGLSLPVVYGIHRYSPRFRTFPLYVKAAGVVMFTSAATVIVAERAGIRFDQEKYSKSLYGSEQVEKMKEEERKRVQGLEMGERAKEWVNKNKYSVILGGWAATMGAAWAVINRDKYMTFSQKIVQVRMWAQGVTIAMIIGTAILSQADRQKAREHPPVDHSWMTQLGENPENAQVQKITTA